MVYLILSPLLSLALLSGMTASPANKNGNDKERYVILMWLCFLLAPSLGGLAAFLPRATYFDFSLFIGITIASWPFGCLPASVTAVLAAALKLHRNPQGVATMTFIGSVCGLLFGILNADIVGIPLSGTTLAGAIAAFAFSCLLPKERPSENERSEFLTNAANFVSKKLIRHVRFQTALVYTSPLYPFSRARPSETAFAAVS